MGWHNYVELTECGSGYGKSSLTREVMQIDRTTFTLIVLVPALNMHSAIEAS